MTYAKVIADSITEDNDRLVTMEVRFHRFVLAEFNTHRVFSRNSASSRAIPVEKQIQRLMDDLAFPLEWPAEQRGMQGGKDVGQPERTRRSWRRAMDAARHEVGYLSALGVHKSVVNRLLEPFMWHTAVVTSTAWGNFFDQRVSPLAQPEIRAVARKMRNAWLTSEPRLVKEFDWHLPYLNEEERTLPDAEKVSAARCARVSYLTQDGVRDVSKDLELYTRLTTAKPPHWSPLEHVATPWADNRQGSLLEFMDPGGYTWQVETEHLPRVGNLLGWRSLRTSVETYDDVRTYR